MGMVRIFVRGQIDPEWTSWFEGFEIHSVEDGTMLRGDIIDQSALYGVLAKLRDLGLELISVQREDDQATPQGS